MEKRRVAVFDIDGTVFRSSLLIELVERLIDKDIFPQEAREAYEAERRRWLDRKGDYDSYIFLLAISHSPKFIVDGFGYEAGFDKVYGTFYATGASGNFTGTIEDEDLIKNKAAVLTRAVRKEGLTFEQSFAVGDSESDIGLLDMVERPIAFNPNQTLYTYAARRGWKVVAER